MPSRRFALLCVICALLITGCKKDEQPRVVIYTSVDQPVAAPILQEFEKRTGIKVEVQTDTEATKSAGLAARLTAEKDRPQADVWWGNEVFHTINLAEAGVLAPYESASAKDVPAKFKDPQHRWAGTCLRARVLAVHTGVGDVRTGPTALPVKRLADLKDPAFRGRVAMARPTAGTTGGHVAALYVAWGPQEADQYFKALRDNGVKLLGGNSVVADQVGQGNVWVGMTDNDDVDAAKRGGGKLEMVLPDQGKDDLGTLAIPCTAGLVKGAKNDAAAKQLIDYLLSAEVEQKLLAAKFGRYSVRPGGGVEQIKTMDVDYRAAAKALPAAVQNAVEILEGRR